MYFFVVYFVSFLTFIMYTNDVGAEKFYMPEHLKRVVFAMKQQGSKLGGDFITVGSAQSCDYSNVQEALLEVQMGSVSEIRVANSGSPYSGPMIIEGFDVQIVGGYATCADADMGQVGASNTVFQGTGSASIITVQGEGDRSYVSIKNIDFDRNGLSGPAIYADEVDASIVVENSLISNGYAIAAASIIVQQGATDFVLKDVSIKNNTVTQFDTAGVYCEGGNSSVLIHGHSEISNNRAENGVAVQAWGFCEITVFSPTTIKANTMDVGQSIGGSAVLALGGGRVNLLGYRACSQDICFGVDSEPVKVMDNIVAVQENVFNLTIATGIHAEGQNSQVTAVNTLVSDNNYLLSESMPAINGPNTRVINVSASDYGKIRFETVNHKSCWSPGKCTQLSGAQVQMRIMSHAELSIVNAYIGVGGTVYNPFVIENNAHLKVLGSQIKQEGDGITDYCFFHNKEAQVDLTSSSIYAVAGDSDFDDVICASGTSVYNFDASILFVNESDLNAFWIVQDASVNFRCSLISGLGTIDNQVNVNINQSLPLMNSPFVGVNGTDMHIKPDSEANDFCGFLVENSLDMDGDQRGYDDPLQNNLYGPYDVGADEVIVNDIIFKNGFEQI